MEKEYYSKSRIDLFKKCKHQYKLKYLDRIKLDQPHSDDLQFGHWIHEALEIYSVDDENLKEIIKLASKYDIRGKEYKAAMPQTLKNAINFSKKYWKYPREVEEHIQYEGDDLLLAGVIDLKMTQKDSLMIVDYKSSKYPNPARHEYQMKMYCYIISKTKEMPPEKIRVMVYYPRIDKYDRWQFSTGEINLFEQELKDDISDIESCKTFDETPGYHCRWCTFLDTEYCDKGEKS